MSPTELVDLPGGTFRMGSDTHYPEERPAHERIVEAFAIERHPVTNAAFAEFVDATGYVTVAEEDIDPAALFEQVVVDKLRLAGHIRQALQGRAQISLVELLAAQPLQHGLAELLAYLQLGTEQFRTVADEAVPEAIYWQAQSADGQAITRCAQLPRLIFMR